MAADETRKSLVPPGAPRWVTDEMIADTLEVWQPYYRQQLTPLDALEIVMNVGRLIDLLAKRSPRLPSNDPGPPAAA